MVLYPNSLTFRDSIAYPAQVTAEVASDGDLQEIAPHVVEFAERFGMNSESLMQDKFYVLGPNAKNPYKQLYTAN